MIISNAHKVVFMHIPKCAGTSVRYRLADLDDTDRYFFGPQQHDALGEFDFSHATLDILATHFPDVFQKIQDYRSFALCRDPARRFYSSVSQYSREYARGEFVDKSAGQQRELVDQIISKLTSDDEIAGSKFKHFVRQADFVFHDGRRVIDNVYAIDQIEKLFSEIETLTGQSIAAPIRKNETVNLRVKSLRPFLKRASDTLKKGLPKQAFDRVQNLGKSVLVKRDDLIPDVFREPFLQSFINDYYAADFYLHKAVTSGTLDSLTRCEP